MKKIDFNQTDKVFAMGRSGCGKSYLAKKIQQKWKKRVIIDALMEYKASENKIINNFDDFANYLVIQKKNKTKEFSVVYQFNLEANETETQAEFDEIMKLCYYFSDLLIVVEEVQIFASTHYLSKWLKNNVLTGRHKNNGLLFTSQRVGEVNKTILPQCSHIFIGNMIEGNDVKYISNFLNQDAKKLSSLKNREFIYFSPNGIFEITNDIKV